MPVIVTLSGPNPGRVFPLRAPETVLGRDTTCAVWLESPAVSRRHARVTCDNGRFFIQDINSANGTLVNGQFIDKEALVPLTEKDRFEIGPYEFAIRQEVEPPSDGNVTETGSRDKIRLTIQASASNPDLFLHNAQRKLQLLVETAQSLGQSEDLNVLLDRLVTQLLKLFPQADRAMVILSEGGELHARAQKQRQHAVSRSMRNIADLGSDFLPGQSDFAFSRSIVKRALSAKVGQLCDNDRAENGSQSMQEINLRSFLCVPLLGLDQQPLGVLQVDCVTPGKLLQEEDLKLLTAVGLHVASVIQNAMLQAERLREESERTERVLAQETQQRLLPQNFESVGGGLFELYARVVPARSVSGDLYDFYTTRDGRLAFFLGDVVGKGMSAALFMMAIRTLTRALAGSTTGPVDLITKMNTTILADNPNEQYVTLAHGTYEPRQGVVEYVSAGHLPPLLRRTNGRVDLLSIENAMAIGMFEFDETPTAVRFQIQPGETLILYSDGITEAHPPDNKRAQFEVDRLCQTLAELPMTMPLAECVEKVRSRIAQFTRTAELSDDQTMMLLRRLR